LAFSLAGAAVETSYFTARKGELQEMREHLRSDGSRKVVVLYGLGGIGKTQLAIRYATRHREDYSALFWLNAKDETSTKLSFVQMARHIRREHPDAPPLIGLDLEQNLDEVVDAVKSWLSIPMNTRWLMVCDNYDNPKLPGRTDSAALELRKYLPEAHQGSVIVTTRSSEVQLGHRIRIQKLKDLEDGLRILEHASGRKKLVDSKYCSLSCESI
jgi:ATP/maltotriose-dependent transcriptional regulator MalT